MQIMLLGDVMGIKSLIKKGEKNQQILKQQISISDRIFSDCFAKYHQRSRSMYCLVFSDSYITIWTDYREGCRFCTTFAQEFYQKVSNKGIPFRIFVDKGTTFEIEDFRTSLYSSYEPRFLKFTPISISSWSVFYGEASHFQEGVYFGPELEKDLQNKDKCYFSDISCIVGDFSFKKMTI